MTGVVTDSVGLLLESTLVDRLLLSVTGLASEVLVRMLEVCVLLRLVLCVLVLLEVRVVVRLLELEVVVGLCGYVGRVCVALDLVELEDRVVEVLCLEVLLRLVVRVLV